MDLASLLIAHHVLALGGIRETAKVLDRPVSSVSAALARLQFHIATPLTTTSGNRIQPTLEGVRIGRDLQRAAMLVGELSGLGDKDGSPEDGARLSVPLLALQRFLVVGRSGSIRRAAQEIGIGQPQLTRQIRSLERDLGLPLLDRAAAGAVPNASGQRVIALGEELEAIWLKISDHAGDRFRRAASTTRIGSVTPLGRESLIARILAKLAADWPKHMPRRPLYISSTNAEELLSGITDRTYDLVLVDTLDMPPGVEHRVISRSGLAMVGAADVIADHRGDLRQLLLRHPIALPSLKSGLRQKFGLLTEDILTPDERAGLSFVEIDSIPVIANLVSDHGYIALLPLWAIPQPDERMAAIALPEAYDMHLSLAWKKGAAAETIARTAEHILGSMTFPVTGRNPPAA
ncbi:MAG: LysR family transcriptional regulator [Rhizobiaceae bacterium]|nr:MAG: LysR family transcriptional regulator [Rhizobiaceae bacterium]